MFNKRNENSPHPGNGFSAVGCFCDFRPDFPGDERRRQSKLAEFLASDYCGHKQERSRCPQKNDAKQFR